MEVETKQESAIDHLPKAKSPRGDKSSRAESRKSRKSKKDKSSDKGSKKDETKKSSNQKSRSRSKDEQKPTTEDVQPITSSKKQVKEKIDDKILTGNAGTEESGKAPEVSGDAPKEVMFKLTPGGIDGDLNGDEDNTSAELHDRISEAIRGLKAEKEKRESDNMSDLRSEKSSNLRDLPLTFEEEGKFKPKLTATPEVKENEKTNSNEKKDSKVKKESKANLAKQKDSEKQEVKKQSKDETKKEENDKKGRKSQQKTEKDKKSRKDKKNDKKDADNDSKRRASSDYGEQYYTDKGQLKLNKLKSEIDQNKKSQSKKKEPAAKNEPVEIKISRYSEDSKEPKAKNPTLLRRMSSENFNQHNRMERLKSQRSLSDIEDLDEKKPTKDERNRSRSLYTDPGRRKETDADRPKFAVRGMQNFGNQRSLANIDMSKLSGQMQNILSRSRSLRNLHQMNTEQNTPNAKPLEKQKRELNVKQSGANQSLSKTHKSKSPNPPQDENQVRTPRTPRSSLTNKKGAAKEDASTEKKKLTHVSEGPSESKSMRDKSQSEASIGGGSVSKRKR